VGKTAESFKIVNYDLLQYLARVNC